MQRVCVYFFFFVFSFDRAQMKTNPISELTIYRLKLTNDEKKLKVIVAEILINAGAKIVRVSCAALAVAVCLSRQPTACVCAYVLWLSFVYAYAPIRLRLPLNMLARSCLSSPQSPHQTKLNRARHIERTHSGSRIYIYTNCL